MVNATQPIDWTTLLIGVAVSIGVLVGPWEMALLVHRIWQQRQRERRAGGEDITPRRVPDEAYDED